MRNATRAWLAAGFVLLAACAKDDGKSGGNLRMLAHGGNATTFSAGYGGDVYFYVEGGDVELRKDGGLPKAPSFKWQQPDLGANPLTVDADVTVTPDGSDRVLGDDGENAATGLWVRPGATLTVSPNRDWDGIAGAEVAYLRFAAGVRVDGRVTVTPRNGAGASASDLYLYASNIVVTEDAVVDTSGADGTGEAAGGDAGRIELYPDGSVYNEGTILARGGRGTSGGDGAMINLESSWGFAVNRGTIDSSGGEGTDGGGGSAGWNEVWADEDGSAINTGTMRARGGNGTTGGGNGSSIYVGVSNLGFAYSSGELDASGGDATVAGDGGWGGWVELDAAGADATAGGKMIARGGNGAGESGRGAGGGGVGFYLEEGWSNGNIETPAGRLVVGAEIDVAGGDGAYGGSGGDIDVYVESYRASPQQPQVRFVGYAAIDLTGGDSAGSYETHGSAVWSGSGGDVEIALSAAQADAGGYRVGGVTNEVDVLATGGDALEGYSGGEGGSLDVYFENGRFLVAELRSAISTAQLDGPIVNRGQLELAGGSAQEYGGGGGWVYLAGLAEARNEGDVLAAGGSGRFGGYGGWVDVYGDSRAVLSGAVRAEGGAGVDHGGGGGGAYVVGSSSRIGSVVADGGAASGTADEVSGGDGGWIGVVSATSASSTGRLSVAPGAGVVTGDLGEVWVDGFRVALTDGKFGK